MIVVDDIKDIAHETKKSLRTFRNAPLENLAYLIPVATMLLSLTAFIVTFIVFIYTDGYSAQIAYMRGSSDYDDFTKLFTAGTILMFIIATFPISAIALFVVQPILALTLYWRIQSKAKRIAAVIFLGITYLILISITCIIAIEPLYGSINTEAYDKLVNAVNNFLPISFLIYGRTGIISLAFFVSLITFLIYTAFIVRSQFSWIVRITTTAIKLNFVILPLVLLALENIVPLILLSVILIVLLIVVASAGQEQSASNESTKEAKPQPTKEAKPQPTAAESTQTVRRFDGSRIFWRGRGTGIWTPEYSIFTRRSGTHEETFVCSVHDFESGKVAIFNGKDRVVNISGCQSPKR